MYVCDWTVSRQSRGETLVHKMDIYHLLSQCITWRHRSERSLLVFRSMLLSFAIYSRFKEILPWILFDFVHLFDAFVLPSLKTYNFWTATPMPFFNGNTVIHWDNKSKKKWRCANTTNQTEKFLFYFILNEMLISDDISWLTISWEYGEEKKRTNNVFSLQFQQLIFRWKITCNEQMRQNVILKINENCNKNCSWMGHKRHSASSKIQIFHCL